MKIGILGLGAIGRQMALNFLEDGHQVTVWNRSTQVVSAVVEAGAIRAERPQDALQGDLALWTLFGDKAIRAVLLDSDALERANKNCIQVCMSTISIGLAHELVGLHQKMELPYVGAPFLGRPEALAQRGLTILTGGEASLVTQLEAPFAALGRLWPIGPDPVHAQMAKLAANFMITSTVQAMTEAAAALRAQGADAGRFLSGMSETMLPIYRGYAASLSGSGGAPSGPANLELLIKDNSYFLDSAQGQGLHLPLARAIESDLQRLAEAQLNAAH